MPSPTERSSKPARLNAGFNRHLCGTVPTIVGRTISALRVRSVADSEREQKCRSRTDPAFCSAPLTKIVPDPAWLDGEMAAIEAATRMIGSAVGIRVAREGTTASRA